MPLRKRRDVLASLTAGGSALVGGCFGNDDPRAGERGDTELTYVYPSSFDSDAADLIPRFEDRTEGVTITAEQTPDDATATREYYINQFVSRASTVDVGNLDIGWAREFARNGWTNRLDDRRGLTEALLDTAVDTVTVDGELHAMPVFTDANALYYRSDKLAEYGYDDPPETYTELVAVAQDVLEQDDDLTNGYVWQGGPNEGLTIMWLNWLWGMDGTVQQDRALAVDSEQGIEALQHAVDLVYEHEVTPRSVLASTFDGNRETFGEGETLFMRNWSYAVARLNEEASPVAGRFDVAPLPTHEDHLGVRNSCLGGWNLFVNAFSQHPEVAAEFLEFVVSPAVQRRFARVHGRLPVRSDLYEDDVLADVHPAMTTFERALDRTRARPPIEDYPRFSEIVFTECHNALLREKTPAEALSDAQDELDATIE